MAKRIGVYDVYGELIANWRREGYSLQEIGDKVGVTRERIRQILNRYSANLKSCLVCGKQISVTRRYCPECRVIPKKNRYRSWTEEEKKQHKERCRKWRVSHPEKCKDILNRARTKYNEARRLEHYAKTIYIVTKQGSNYPIGHQFKAIGTMNRYLFLADGSNVPIGIVRRKI